MELQGEHVQLTRRERALPGVESECVPATEIGDVWRGALEDLEIRQLASDAAPVTPVALTGPGVGMVSFGAAHWESRQLRRDEKRLRKMAANVLGIEKDTL